MSDHLQFMKQMLPLLDAADFVDRYSWMSARDPNGKRGLLSSSGGQAQLTELGEVWNS